MSRGRSFVVLVMMLATGSGSLVVRKSELRTANTGSEARRNFTEGASFETARRNTSGMEPERNKTNQDGMVASAPGVWQDEENFAPEKKGESQLGSCSFEEQVYQHDEEWDPDGCTRCHCNRGIVICSVKSHCNRGDQESQYDKQETEVDRKALSEEEFYDSQKLATITDSFQVSYKRKPSVQDSNPSYNDYLESERRDEKGPSFTTAASYLGDLSQNQRSDNKGPSNFASHIDFTQNQRENEKGPPSLDSLPYQTDFVQIQHSDGKRPPIKLEPDTMPYYGSYTETRQSEEKGPSDNYVAPDMPAYYKELGKSRVSNEKGPPDLDVGQNLLQVGPQGPPGPPGNLLVFLRFFVSLFKICY
ncbi:unnamed protein product [Bemisia tabaci]|uniref:Uncharacterized protein n=1 Tax=Bemisia tabaci TaxID=7038 RepID=A0A9P0F9H4_BEMTA|nr:unnamed protein product [Bemisia tabaci]